MSVTKSGIRYNRLRQQKLCAWCGKVESDKTYCPACKIKILALIYRRALLNPEYNLNYIRRWMSDPDNRARKNLLNKIRKHKLYAEGRCTNCAVENDRPGKWLCSRCAELQRVYYMRWLEKQKTRQRSETNADRADRC